MKTVLALVMLALERDDSNDDDGDGGERVDEDDNGEDNFMEHSLPASGI